MLFGFSFTLFKEDIALRFVVGFWLVRGSALGPICGLSARQLNSCLPRREERKRKKTKIIGLPYGEKTMTIC